MIYILHIVYAWCDIDMVDPLQTSEMALALAVILEMSTSCPKCSNSEGPDDSGVAILLNLNYFEKLIKAREITTVGLSKISAVRRNLIELREEDVVNLMQACRTLTRFSLFVSIPSRIFTLNVNCSLIDLIKDMHLELLVMYYRICLKLAFVRLEDSTLFNITAKKLNVEVLNLDELAADCKKNKLNKALLYMQHARLIKANVLQQNKLLQDALVCIKKCRKEEKNQDILLNQKLIKTSKSPIPPPPLLIFSEADTMIFKPVNFALSDQVAWYRIFGRLAIGPNLKVRLNDCLPGSEETISARECKLCISGLIPNEYYMIAVAAYNDDGLLIGGKIGESSEPILAAHSLNSLTACGFLIQIAYEVGDDSIIAKASTILWDYFVSSEKIKRPENYSKVHSYYLSDKAVKQATPMMLHLFQSSIFISIQRRISRWDSWWGNSDKVMLQQIQLKYLEECKIAFIALEINLLLSDNNGSLQAVIFCYGLLAPLLHFEIFNNSIMQMLIKCFVILEEILPIEFLPDTVVENLHHMVGCMSYYLTKASKQQGETELSKYFAEHSLVLLQLTAKKPVIESTSTQGKLAKVKSNVVTSPGAKETFIASVEYKSFQAFVLKVGLLAPSTLAAQDIQVIYSLMSGSHTDLHKEISKFRHHQYFQEFLMKCLTRLLHEGHYELVLSWYTEFNSKLSTPTIPKDKKDKKKVLANTYPTIQHLALNLPFYSKPRPKTYGINLTHQDASLYLLTMIPEFVYICWQQRKLREIHKREGLWKSMMNLTQALATFAMFKQKVNALFLQAKEEKECTTWYNVDWCTLECVGILIHSCPGSVCSVSKLRVEVINPEEVIQPVIPELDKKGKKNKKGTEFKSVAKINKVEDSLYKTFTFFLKAIVLAHRGEHWMTLQNICRSLITTINSAFSFLSFGPITIEGDTLSEKLLLSFLWPACSMAANCVLDLAFKLLYFPDKYPLLSLVLNNPNGSSDISEAIGSIQYISEQWIKRLIMISITILFSQSKWERVVDIILRFNGLFRNRYLEELTPLLIFCQEKLLEQINSENGPKSSQPQFLTAQDLSPEGYLCFQLKIQKQLQPEDCANANLKLISVPLDVQHSIQSVKDYVSTADTGTRYLKNCRKLLCLFIIGLSKSVEISNAKLKHTDITSISLEAIHYALHPTSIDVIIKSYQKTLEILPSSESKHLFPQVMLELGTLFIYKNDISSAYCCWVAALDQILKHSNTIQSWRALFSSGKVKPENLLEFCGIPGCILGGLLCAKIARYIANIHQKTKMECCFLATVLFKALFINPSSKSRLDIEFIDFENVSKMHKFLPDLDFLPESLFSDASHIIAAIQWVIGELVLARHQFMVMPLFTLHQYFAAYVCQNIHFVINSYLQKALTLTNLCIFKDAAQMLLQVLYWEGLPQFSGIVGNSNSNLNSVFFDNSKPILDPQNLQILEILLESSLSNALINLYGPYLSYLYLFVVSHFFITIASSISSVPIFPETLAPSTKRDMKSTVKMDLNYAYPYIPGILTSTDKPATLELVKGIILAATKHKLNYVIKRLTPKAANSLSQLSPFNMELLVKCQKSLAEVYYQSHIPEIAINKMMYIFDALKSYLNSDVVVKESIFVANELWIQPCSIKLWLECRLALVKYVIDRNISGKAFKQKSTISLNVIELCHEGMVEAECCFDIETCAEFLLLMCTYTIQQGKCNPMIISKLEDCLKLFNSVEELSTEAYILYLQTDALRQELKCQNQTSTEIITQMNEAQVNLITRLKQYGELWNSTTEDNTLDFSQWKSPHNIYLPLWPCLLICFCRQGYTTAIRNSQSQVSESVSDQQLEFVKALSKLNFASRLNASLATYDQYLQSAIFFDIGQVMRQLYAYNMYNEVEVTETLVKAIHLSASSIHDFRIIRQAYLEIALLYMDVKEKLKKKIKERTRRKSTVWKLGEMEEHTEFTSPEIEVAQHVAWNAVKCAAATMNANQNLLELVRTSTLKSTSINTTIDRTKLTQFLLYEIKSPLIDIQLIEDSRGSDTPISKPMGRRSSKGDISETKEVINTCNVSLYHILQYQALLKNKLDASTLVMTLTADKETEECQVISLGPALTYIRYPFLYRSIVPRLNYLQKFMVTQLEYYRLKCVAKSPQDLMNFINDPNTSFDLDGKPLQYNEMSIESYLPELGNVGRESGDIVLVYAILLKQKPYCGTHLIYQSKQLDLLKYLCNAEYLVEMSVKSNQPVKDSLQKISNYIAHNVDLLFREAHELPEVQITFGLNLKMLQELRKFFDPNFGFVLTDPKLFKWLCQHFIPQINPNKLTI